MGPANTFTDLQNVGWIIGETKTKEYGKPSEFNHLLQPLDDDATDVWQVMPSGTPSTFNFNKFTDATQEFCDLESVVVRTKYFSEMASAVVSPCERNAFYCYMEPPDAIKWEVSTIEINLAQLSGTEIEILLYVPLDPVSYILFDQITIDFVGVECSTTTVSTEEKAVLIDLSWE